MDKRKIELILRTTPLELRLIAEYLEQGKPVRYNWYHTRIIFANDDGIVNINEDAIIECGNKDDT